MNAIYARVSTEEQARSGYSLPDQVRRCREKLHSMGLHDITEYIDDGYSGEFIDRPKLDRLRNDIYSGLIKNVVVYDLDRLSRETDHLLILVKEIEKKATLIFVTNEYAKTPAGELFMTIHAAMAKYEKATIKERSMRGKRQKALSGKLSFDDKPLGYDFDKEKSMYVINEIEAETVRLIFDLYIKTSYGVRRLSKELALLGKTNKKGLPLTQSNIRRIILNEMYAGTKWAFKRYDKKIGQRQTKEYRRDRSEWIPIKVPAIVSRETWLKAQQCIKAKRTYSVRNKKYEYLLSGLIRCEKCGYAMIGQTFFSPRKYSYYICSSVMEKRGICDARRIPVDELDSAVWDFICEYAGKNTNIKNVKQVDEDLIPSKPTIERIHHLEETQAEILKWISVGTLEKEVAGKQLLAISKDISELKDQLNKIEQKNANRKIVTIPKDILSAITFEEKRDIMLKLELTFSAVRNDKQIQWWIL